MEHNNKIPWWAIPAAVAFVAWFLFRQGKKAGDETDGRGSGEVPGCTSANSDAQIKKSVDTCRAIFENYFFFISADEENAIVNSLRYLDECGVRQFYAGFGVYSSVTRGSGNFDYWAGKLSDETKDQLRKILGTQAGF